MFCDTGIPRTFYGGKICSVGIHIFLIFYHGFVFKKYAFHTPNNNQNQKVDAKELGIQRIQCEYCFNLGWEAWRDFLIDHFPQPPKMPKRIYLLMHGC